METIGVVEWAPGDELAATMKWELEAQGYAVILFPFGGVLPLQADIILSFAPYGPFLQMPAQLAELPLDRRPVFVHWNTEGIPNPSLPWWFVRSIAEIRSSIGRIEVSNRSLGRPVARNSVFYILNSRMSRFRYVGDYYYAHRLGWMDVYADFSKMYANFHTHHGLPALYVPWGSSPLWRADLNLKREIDVLYMGKRRKKSRGQWIDRIRADLVTHGVEMVVIDGIERPFVFGTQRTRILNQTKIIINLLNEPWDCPLAHRFHMAAGNRCMVVSESHLAHFPELHPGVHYAVASPEDMAETILYYLNREDKRQQIVDNAYELATTSLTLSASLAKLVDAARAAHARRYNNTPTSLKTSSSVTT